MSVCLHVAWLTVNSSDVPLSGLQPPLHLLPAPQDTAQAPSSQVLRARCVLYKHLTAAQPGALRKGCY